MRLPILGSGAMPCGRRLLLSPSSWTGFVGEPTLSGSRRRPHHADGWDCPHTIAGPSTC